MPSEKVLFRKKKGGIVEMNWLCLKEKCPKNCCGHFFDRMKYYSSVKGINHDEIPLLPDEAKKYIASGQKKNIIKNSKDYFIKLKRSDRSCPLFVEGKCSIYDSRPSYCKAYPFLLDLASNINIDTSCPGFGKGWTNINDVKPFIKSLLQVYKKYIQDTDKNKLNIYV